MELLPLEHFIAVVEERSFSRAAEKVLRTQPAVSQSIKKLEEEIGTPLFARDTPELALTEAGKVLLDYAHRMLSLRYEAFDDLAQLKSLNGGTVTIAAHESAAHYLLPSALRDYAKKFPRIKIELHGTPVSEISEKVLEREVDLGFVVEKPAFHELRSVRSGLLRRAHRFTQTRSFCSPRPVTRWPGSGPFASRTSNKNLSSCTTVAKVS